MAMKVSKNRIAVTILASIVLVLFFATVAGLFYYKEMINSLGRVQEEDFTEYHRLYAYIPEDPDSQLSTSIYKEISAYAAENGCYVEMTGQNLSTRYSKSDRLNIAISSKVDGIIVEGDDSAETLALIDKATANGIPVITVLTDCDSTRKSFVGLNNFSLGTEYGEELLDIASDKNTYPFKVLVLLDRDDGNADDIIYSGIQESVADRRITLMTSVIDTSSPFSAQEDVTNLLDSLDENPDVIISLNDRTSESVYQCIVDKNLVGQVTVLGYFDSETILKAIDRGSVYATFAIEANVVAKQCVDALNEYYNSGFVSDYYSSKYLLINRDNISEYRVEETEDGG